MVKSLGEFKVVPVHDMKAYGVIKIKLQSFLTLQVDGGECSPSSQGRFTSREELLVPIE
jgi:hypothetical protein